MVVTKKIAGRVESLLLCSLHHEGDKTMKNKKGKKKPSKILIIYLLYIILAILDVYTKGQKRYLTYLKIGTLTFFVVYSIIEIGLLLKAAQPIIFKWFKIWSPIILTIVITLAIPIGIHFLLYDGQPIGQDALITAYATYLTFVGAFSLGYYLYKREEIRRYEALKKKARLLYDTMFDIQITFRNIEAFIERGEAYPIVDNWRSDYLDIKHLVTYKETALDNELKYFFTTIESINKAIQAGDKGRAQKIYSRFEHKEKYASSEYNYMDAEEVLLFISLDMPQQKPWKDAEKEQIEKYAEQFFSVVNLWIFNYLKKHNLSSCDADLIEYDLAEWLLTNPELRAWVKHPYENRKIMAVIFNIALAMNKKSENLNYVWGEFSLK